MRKFKICCMLLISLLFLQCDNFEPKAMDSKPVQINDINYVLNSNYALGDARRYGIFPDSLNDKKHPNTGKSLISSVLDLAENSPIKINFPKGYYGVNLVFNSRKNIDLHFNEAAFDLVHITNEGGSQSRNITLEGTLILYEGFGIYHSKNVTADSVIIKLNPQKTLKESKSRGCHIYKGTDSLLINYLEIEDLASGNIGFKNNHAALAIDGSRENPTNITINEVYIKSSDRHGAYITGTNNIFKKIKIDKYAQGTTNFMTGMQDAGKGNEKILSGLWINRCNNCIFENVQILTKYSKNGYPLKLDEGNSGMPTIIENLVLDVEYKDALILDDILTNVLVKRLKTIE